MKLSGASIDRFLRAPDPKVSAVLVYGPDGGLVRERADALTRLVAGSLDDPFNVAELTPAALKDDPARLRDEAAALSFTGGRRVIRMSEVGDSQAGAVQALLLEGASAGFVVLQAGDLPAKSSLRKVFEAAPHAAALPCYRDEGKSLERLIEEHLRERGLSIARDALQYLTANLGGDRGITRAELDKLALYVSKGRVELEAAMACVGDSAELTGEEVAYAAADRDAAALARALDRQIQEGASAIMLLRAAGRHFLRLQMAAALRDSGRGAEAAVAALRPPVFFRQVPRFTAQLERWSEADLARAVDLLLEAELACKSPGMSPVQEVLCRNAFFALTRRAAA